MAFGAPIDEAQSVEKRDNFVWGSLGDSWAAGVSYSPWTTTMITMVATVGKIPTVL
jgi:hypothetical protein